MEKYLLLADLSFLDLSKSYNVRGRVVCASIDGSGEVVCVSHRWACNNNRILKGSAEHLCQFDIAYNDFDVRNKKFLMFLGALLKRVWLGL